MASTTEICGKYTTAKIFTENFDMAAYSQIKQLCDQSFTDGCKVRVMPDVHAGAGCVIGFTANLGKKVVPSIVGVDLGCGMLVAGLGKVDIDLSALDRIIHSRIPAGLNVHNSRTNLDFGIYDLRCISHLKNLDWIFRSMGTLGGGNHFIELDVDDEGCKYLVIHTGSRNLGKQVAEFYQNLAISNFYGKNRKKEAREILIDRLKSEGREKDISAELAKLRLDTQSIPKELCYLEGDDREDYLQDMELCQAFAAWNRSEILIRILGGLGLLGNVCSTSCFETVHNYIGYDGIIRKGAVSARKGEKLIIPLNMRDGSLICIGKGNPDWNFSAPHGAGRVFSRAEAKRHFNVDEYRKEMDGIYSTSVNESTLDECPLAYKPAHCIIDAIEPTVDIVKRIRPIYNFKAGE